MPKPKTYQDGKFKRTITPDTLRFYTKKTNEYCEINKTVFKQLFISYLSKILYRKYHELTPKNVDEHIKDKMLSSAQFLSHHLKECGGKYRELDKDYTIKEVIVDVYEKFLYDYMTYDKFYLEDFFKNYTITEVDKKNFNALVKSLLKNDKDNGRVHGSKLILVYFMSLVSIWETVTGNKKVHTFKSNEDFFVFDEELVSNPNSNPCPTVIMKRSIRNKLLKDVKKGHNKRIKKFFDSYRLIDESIPDCVHKPLHFFVIDDDLFLVVERDGEIIIEEIMTLYQIYHEKGIDNILENNLSLIRVNEGNIKVDDLFRWLKNQNIPYDLASILFWRYYYKYSHFDELEPWERHSLTQKYNKEIDDIIKGDKQVVVKNSNDKWVLIENMNSNLGRNDKCSCGSGLKFKKCCLN